MIPVPGKQISIRDVFFALLVIYLCAFIAGSIAMLLADSSNQLINFALAFASFGVGGFSTGIRKRPYVFFTVMYAVLISLVLLLLFSSFSPLKMIGVHVFYSIAAFIGVAIGVKYSRKK